MPCPHRAAAQPSAQQPQQDLEVGKGSGGVKVWDNWKEAAGAYGDSSGDTPWATCQFWQRGGDQASKLGQCGGGQVFINGVILEICQLRYQKAGLVAAAPWGKFHGRGPSGSHTGPAVVKEAPSQDTALQQQFRLPHSCIAGWPGPAPPATRRKEWGSSAGSSPGQEPQRG